MPEDLVRVFHFFALLADWRDERKKEVLIYIHCLNEILEKLAEKNKVKLELLKYALPQEIKSWILPSSYLKILQERAKEYLFEIDSRGFLSWIEEPVRRQILEAVRASYKRRFKEIKGVSASPGRARGKVKIIETMAEFKKMKRGDILVANMTRPEFMPLIKLASAIVTDEGGLTCHAAIVARELKIPCVVGTQTATKNLRDGQLIEVDADKGIVRIIKKS